MVVLVSVKSATWVRVPPIKIHTPCACILKAVDREPAFFVLGRGGTIGHEHDGIGTRSKNKAGHQILITAQIGTINLRTRA